MNNSGLLVPALVALACAPQIASAETGLYGGAGYTNIQAGDFSVGALTGRLGYRFSDYFGVEGEASFGVADDTFIAGTTPPTEVSMELSDAYGASFVGFWPVQPNFDILGRIGYSTYEISGSASCGTGCTVSSRLEGDGGMTYGIGGQYFFGERFGIRVEYGQVEGDGVSAETWGVQGVLKF